jgi:hypothetical protein
MHAAYRIHPLRIEGGFPVPASRKTTRWQPTSPTDVSTTSQHGVLDTTRQVTKIGGPCRYMVVNTFL